MKVRFYDIEFETDGQELEIANELTTQVPADTNLDEEGAEVISNETGYLVLAFQYEVLS